MSLLTFKNSNIQDTMQETSSRTREGSDLRSSYRLSGIKQTPRLANLRFQILSLTDLKPTIEALQQVKKLKSKITGTPSKNQIISGYFIKEKSYKEMVIARINNFLCGVLTLLYWFVWLATTML